MSQAALAGTILRPPESHDKGRVSRTSAQKGVAFERRSQAARDSIAEEHRRRDEKTERLRTARLQAEQQQRQL